MNACTGTQAPVMPVGCGGGCYSYVSWSVNDTLLHKKDFEDIKYYMTYVMITLFICLHGVKKVHSFI